MKILSLINDPQVIERILRHLGLWKQHPPPRDTKSDASSDGPIVTEHFDDGWPGYQEPWLIGQ